jgi:hypothetical protein
MVYTVEYRTCDGCDENKPQTDFYKTIKKICKMCRDEYMKEQRQQSKEEEEIANMKRDQDIKKLKKTTITQRDTIRKMEGTIAIIEERMTNMEVGLGDITPSKFKRKGMLRIK